MAAVQDQDRLAAQHLEAGRPFRQGKAAFHRLIRQDDTAVPQSFHGLQGRCGIAQLMPAQQRKPVFPSPIPKALSVQTVPEGFQHVFSILCIGCNSRCLVERDHPVAADFADHCHGLRRAAVADGSGAAFQNAAFGTGNLFQGAAKILCMVQADVGNDGSLGRINDIGGIHRAAHAHFEHNIVAAHLAEIEHADGRDYLKLAGVVLHGVGLNGDQRGDGGKCCLGDIFSVHLDTLAEILQVRRRIKAGTEAGLPQDPLDHGTGAPLAVCSGHVDESQILLGIAQPLEQLPGSVEAQARAAPGIVVDIGNCLLNSHIQLPFP